MSGADDSVGEVGPVGYDRVSYLEASLKEVSGSYRIPFLAWPGFPFDRPFWPSRKVALDLGANVGAFSIAYAPVFKFIFAIEASSRCIREAQSNLNSFNISNVSLIHAACGSISGEEVALKRTYVEDTWELGNLTTFAWDMAEVERSQAPCYLGEVEEVVHVVDWGDIQNMIGSSRISFVKCDIEGAEYDLFMGKDLRSIDFMVMELHYTALGPARTRELLDHLGKCFDFYLPGDERRFYEQWPPPAILRLTNKRTNSFTRHLTSQMIGILRKIRKIVKGDLTPAG